MASPEWVKALCTDWGKVKRDRLFGSGYPGQSAIFQLLSGRGSFVQRWREVMVAGELLQCDRAVNLMETALPDAWRAICFEHVLRASHTQACNALEWKRWEYRDALAVGYGFIAARCDPPLRKSA